MKCTKCGFESQLGMQFCGRCGSRLAQPCPSCGFANPSDYQFCGMCGNPLLVESPGTINSSSFSTAAFLPIKEPDLQEPENHARVEGERRVATVILADVRRSTDLLEEIGTEAWVGVMNRVFQILEAEIYRFGGHVDQFRGDGLVAFFGTQSAHEDDPERAVLASLSMQQGLANFAQDLLEKEGIEIRMRVGVNTGNVIVASVGDSRQHQEDTAMGEAVALAARLETVAEPGTILVSENTYRLTQNRFLWQPLGKMTLKGINRPLDVFRPLSPRFDFEATPTLQAYGMPVSLTGREAEFNTLKGAIEDLHRGRGGVVLVTGDKGLGKSLLITQVYQHFLRQEVLLQEKQTQSSPDYTSLATRFPASKITWLRGTCRSYDQTWPFSMWLDLLLQWLGMRPDEDIEEKRSRLHSWTLELWGESQDRYYPYIATFLGVPLEDKYLERVRYLDAEGLRKQFYVSIRSWVELLAQRSPLVLLFTDLQWVDVASLDLLKYCLPLCDSQALIWMTIFRPDRSSPAWGFRHHVETEFPHRLTSIDMRPLNDAESVQLIQDLVGTKGLTDRTMELITSKAEGNPYFIREIISSLITQEVLVQDSTTCSWHEASEIDNLNLPDSLQSLLLERLDKLSVDERRVLQAASVMGLSFWYEVLQAIIDVAPVDSHLTSLQRKGIIQERSLVAGLGMEYIFSSSLARDVIYESLLLHQRMTYHRKVAVFLEECDCLDQWIKHSSLIAYHYRYANDPRKELFYAMKAADQARQVYANLEACEHLTRALDVLAELGSKVMDEPQKDAICTQKFEVLAERSQVNGILGRFHESIADSRTLLTLADQMDGDVFWRIDALLRQPEVVNPKSTQDVEAGLAMTLEVLSLSRKLADRHRELHGMIYLTNLYFLLHNPEWKSTGEQALELARQLGNIRAQVDLLLFFGSAYGIDDLGRSLQYLETASQLCQQLDDKTVEIRLLRAFAEQYERNGDYYRQLTDFEQKRLELSRVIGDRIAEGYALMHCAQVQGLYLGDLEAGLALAEESERCSENTMGSLFPLLRIAQIQIALGRYKNAQETLKKAELFTEGNVWDLGRAGFALVSQILNNQLVGEENLQQVLSLHERVNQQVLEKLVSRQYQMVSFCEVSAACLRLAVLARSDPKRKEYRENALSASRSALEIYYQFGFVQVIECSLQEIYYRHSQALRANGFLDEASTFLEYAYKEMMRKHDLIPPKSSFRKTYMGRIKLHRQIREDYFLNAASEGEGEKRLN